MKTGLEAKKTGATCAFRSLRRRVHLLILFLLSILPFPILADCPEDRARPGDLDCGLDGDGRLLTNVLLDNVQGQDFVRGLIAQDGKVVAVGSSAINVKGEVSSIPRIALARYKKDLTLDRSFGKGKKGLVRLDRDDGFGGRRSEEGQVVVAQSDGKLVVAGSRRNLDGDSVTNIILARLSTKGRLEKDFTKNGVVPIFPGSREDRIFALVLQPQPNGTEKIVGAGVSDKTFALFRFNADGTLDEDFGPEKNGRVLTDFPDVDPNGKDDSRAHALVRQDDGKLLAVGITDMRREFQDFGLARYDADGFPDGNFGDNGVVVTNFGDVFRLPNGRVNNSRDNASAAVLLPDDGGLVVGGFSDPRRDCLRRDFALAWYDRDGHRNTSIGNNGLVRTDFRNQREDGGDEILAIVPQFAADRTLVRLIAVGVSRRFDIVSGDPCTGKQRPPQFALAGYKPDGEPDESFGPKGDGIVLTPLIAPGRANSGTVLGDIAFAAVLVDSGRKLLAAGGSFANVDRDFALARYFLTERRAPKLKQCKSRSATIVGTSRKDNLRGTLGNDVILGLKGDDILLGLAGDDTICGGPGKDLLIGGPGIDRLLGDEDDDTLRGKKEDRLLDGGGGIDFCRPKNNCTKSNEKGTEIPIPPPPKQPKPCQSRYCTTG